MAGKSQNHDVALLTALAESDGALADSARRILTALGVVAEDADADTAEVVAVTPKRKRTASTKSAPKATAARRKRGEKATEWIVRESWKGQDCSTRMLGFAVKCGVPAAILKRGDKFEVSSACGKSLGLPIIVQD